ncbi:AfsR/SARP family transcriptional regulator [Saccharothrix sp. AJ9571]|nr:AfsR/SARP family transcriptional regulator [Saccharothrix sp. AJ9571]
MTTVTAGPGRDLAGTWPDSGSDLVAEVGIGESPQRRPGAAGTRVAWSQGSEAEFRLLGPVEVRSGGRALPLGTSRERTILLIRPGALTGIAQIIDELWPHDPPADARTLVHEYVSRLRRSFRGDGEAAGQLLSRKPGSLLRADSFELGLSRFNRLCADARAARRDGKPRLRHSLLSQAHQLWRGGPYAGITTIPASAATVARLTGLRLTMLEELFDVALDFGQDAEVTAELTELVAVHPFRKRLGGQPRAGRTADALTIYREARHRLTTALSIEPGTELVNLESTLLNGGQEQKRTTTVPGAPDHSTTALGHLLRGRGARRPNARRPDRAGRVVPQPGRQPASAPALRQRRDEWQVRDLIHASARSLADRGSAYTDFCHNLDTRQSMGCRFVLLCIQSPSIGPILLSNPNRTAISCCRLGRRFP